MGFTGVIGARNKWSYGTPTENWCLGPTLYKWVTKPTPKNGSPRSKKTRRERHPDIQPRSAEVCKWLRRVAGSSGKVHEDVFSSLPSQKSAFDWTLGFQTPNVRRYDWTPKTYHPNTFPRGIWKTGACHTLGKRANYSWGEVTSKRVFLIEKYKYQCSFRSNEWIVEKTRHFGGVL